MKNKHTRRGNTQQNRVGLPDNKINCHSKLDLESYRVSLRNDEILNQVQDDRMRGFTLIELLVVVLIIGVLAAVALPQYQKSVVKARVATVLPILANLVNAQEVYYLEHGEYATSYKNLDVNSTSHCTLVEGDTATAIPLQCGTDFLVEWDVESKIIFASYCPGHNTSYAECKDYRQFQIGRGSENAKVSATTWAKPHKFRCIKQNSSTFGEEICQSLGKLVEENGKQRWEW